MKLTNGQRILLTLVALFNLLGLNGVFVYYALFHWPFFFATMQNPIALVCILEAFLVMGLLAVFIARRPLGPWGWKTFVVLSLLGGIGFGIPAIVLLNASSGIGTESR